MEISDFVQSNGKLFFNGLGIPAESKLQRLKTSQGTKPSNSLLHKLPLMPTFEQKTQKN
jgi:hypothetical protein